MIGSIERTPLYVLRNSKKAIVEQTIVLSAIEQLNAGGSALATSTFVSDMLRARKYVIGRHGDRLDLLTVEDNGEIIDVAVAPAFSPLAEIPKAVVSLNQLLDHVAL